jgi:hypothetical protein
VRRSEGSTRGKGRSEARRLLEARPGEVRRGEDSRPGDGSWKCEARSRRETGVESR